MKITLPLCVYCIKMLFSSKISKYAKFHFDGVLGIKGLWSLYLVIKQKISWYTLTICLEILKIKNGQIYYHLGAVQE